MIFLFVSCNDIVNEAKHKNKVWDIDGLSVKSLKVLYYKNGNVMDSFIIEDYYKIIKFILTLEDGIKTSCLKLPKKYEIELTFINSDKKLNVIVNDEIARIEDIGCIYIDSNIINHLR